jgi:hypothetical protein
VAETEASGARVERAPALRCWPSKERSDEPAPRGERIGHRSRPPFRDTPQRMNVNPEGGPPPPQAGWFSRNWKWLLAAGCLLPLLCCFGTLALGGVGLFQAVSNNEVYADVKKRVATSPQAAEALGAPVRITGMPQINIQSGKDTQVELSTGVQGSKEKGRLFVSAVERGGAVTYLQLELVTEKGEKVNLLDKSEIPPEPDPVDPANPAPREKPMPDQPEDE